MRRIPDVYLSRKALATWPVAMVWKDDAGDFTLSVPTVRNGRTVEQLVPLTDAQVPAAAKFRTAKEALKLMRDRARAGLELVEGGGE